MWNLKTIVTAFQAKDIVYIMTTCQVIILQENVFLFPLWLNFQNLLVGESSPWL